MRNIDDSAMKSSIDRRAFLGMTGAAAAATVAASLSAPAVAEPIAQAHVRGRRKLGSLEVSSVGLGVQNMSRKYKTTVPYRPEMIEIIRAAYDHGVTFFDTAEAYGPLECERILGEGIAPFRNKVVITSKFGWRAMKTITLGIFLSTLIVPSSYAQQSPAPPTETIKTAASHTPEQ